MFQLEKEPIKGTWRSEERGSSGIWEWRLKTNPSVGTAAPQSSGGNEKGEKDAKGGVNTEVLSWTSALPFELFRQSHCLVYNVVTGIQQVFSFRTVCSS